MTTQEHQPTHSAPKGGRAQGTVVEDAQCECNCAHASAPRPEYRQLMKRMRLVGGLLRQERRSLDRDAALTGAEARAAAQALDARMTATVSDADLAITFETLERIAENLGGVDALQPGRRGRRHFGHHLHSGHRQNGSEHGRSHGRGRGFGRGR